MFYNCELNYLANDFLKLFNLKSMNIKSATNIWECCITKNALEPSCVEEYIELTFLLSVFLMLIKVSYNQNLII